MLGVRKFLLSVIITHYKTPALLKLCLGYLCQNLPKNIESEIIVVDSETMPETSHLIKERFPQVEFVSFRKNIGYGKLVNNGLKKARGDFILIINADILIHHPRTIEKMVNYLKQNPEVGLLGPQLLNINGSKQNSAFKYYTPSIILARRTFLGKISWGKKKLANFPVHSDKPIETDWLMGSALMTKREAMQKVGLIDERFFMYFEDVDWARRFWQNGYKVIYHPETQVYHYHMQASKKRGGFLDVLISKYTRIHIASAIKYFMKHGIK